MTPAQTEQQDDLLVKYLLGECNESEKQRVEEWMQTSEENRSYYHELEKVWEQGKILLDTKEVNTDEAWLRLKQRMEKGKPILQVSKRFYWFVAASVALLLSLFWFLNQEKKSTQPDIVNQHKDTIMALPKKTDTETTWIVSNTQTTIDTLEDRSLITLNKNASLHYPKQFAQNERRVKLKGEAFFSITPNKEKPFFIQTENDVEIRVVGTSFNVKSYPSYTEVIVESGIVAVKKISRVVLLHPQEKAKISQDDSTIVVQQNKDKLYKYYRSKEFDCHGLPLWRLVEVLNEAYGDSVVIGRKELRGVSIHTRFDNLPLENLLEIVCETLEIKVEKQGNKYVLK